MSISAEKVIPWAEVVFSLSDAIVSSKALLAVIDGVLVVVV